MHDVFISFSFQDRPVVDKIVNQLINKYKIPCWICTEQIRAGDDFYGDIEKAISISKILVFVQTKNSVKSDEIPDEIYSAIAQGKTIISFIIEDSELQGGMKLKLRRKQFVDARKPELDDRIKELADEIKRVIGQTADEEDSSNSGNANRHRPQHTISSKLPQTRNVFVGREDVLREMNEFFNTGNRVLFLEGVGGIGKSELAKQYAVRNIDKYDTVVFVSYTENLFSLVCDPNGIEISGVLAEVNENQEEFFERKLRIFRSVADKKTLLILDNFDVDEDDNLEKFLLGTHDVIITTRNQHPGYHSIKVNALNDIHIAFEIFEKNYGMQVSEEDKEHLEKLFKLIEYHTYAIELLAKQMDVGFYSGKELLEMYQSRAYIDNNEDIVQGRSNSKTAYEHMSSLFSMSSLTDNEKTALMELAATGICGVPASSYFCWSSISNIKSIVSGLIRKSWIRRENSDGIHRLTLHPLLIDVLRAKWLAKPTVDKIYIINISKNIGYSTRNSSIKLKDNLAKLDSIISVVDWYSPITTDDDSDLFEAWMEISLFLHSRSLYKEELKVLIDLSKFANSKSQRLHCLEKTLQCYILSGAPDKAVDIMESVASEDLQTDPESCSFEEGKYYVGLLHRGIEAYRDLKNYTLAESYAQKAVLFSRFYERYEGDTLGWTKYHLGRAQMMAGKLLDGKKTLLDSLSIFEKNEDDHACACCYDILALIYALEGNFDDALELNQKAFDLMLPILGNDHIDIGHNNKWRGDILKKRGDIDEYQKYYDNASRIYYEHSCNSAPNYL